MDKLFMFKLNGLVNITYPDGFNYTHGHSGALLSGCYYLVVAEKSGKIVFNDPRPVVEYSPGKMGGPNARTFSVMPKTGQLIIFPSWLEHSVLPNQSNSKRISFPINADPV